MITRQPGLLGGHARNFLRFPGIHFQGAAGDPNLPSEIPQFPTGTLNNTQQPTGRTTSDILLTCLQAFDPNATHIGTFRVSPSETVSVSMMTRDGQFRAALRKDVSVLELPYAGNDLSMIVLLPNGSGGLAALEERLSAEYIDGWVAALDVNEAGLAATKGDRPNVHTYICDVSDAAKVQDVIARIEKDLGTIDRVVHAAGIMPASPVLEDDPVRIKRLMAVNYEGTVNMVFATLKKMVARGGGDFLVFGSVAAYALTPHLGARRNSAAHFAAGAGITKVGTTALRTMPSATLPSSREATAP